MKIKVSTLLQVDIQIRKVHASMGGIDHCATHTHTHTIHVVCAEFNACFYLVLSKATELYIYFVTQTHTHVHTHTHTHTHTLQQH